MTSLSLKPRTKRSFFLFGVGFVVSFYCNLYARAFVLPYPQRQQIKSVSTHVGSSPLFQNEENSASTTGNEFDGFNPFQPGSKIKATTNFGAPPQSSSSQSTPGGQILPRQLRMKELTTDLLACLSNTDAVSELLESNEEFLLDQLNNIDSVLEPDSVFRPDMNRSERFARYREVMDERIGNARSPAAKNVLTVLKDFVLSKQ